MDKLLDRLREEYGIPPAAKRCGVGFLVHKDEIAEALRAGWTIKQIWAQITKDGTATISYTHFCRLVKQHITSSMNDIHGEVSPATTSTDNLAQSEKQAKPLVKSTNIPAHALTEKERLDLMKEEAFRSVRSPKQADPLISKPKSCEEENRELFGE